MRNSVNDVLSSDVFQARMVVGAFIAMPLCAIAPAVHWRDYIDVMLIAAHSWWVRPGVDTYGGAAYYCSGVEREGINTDEECRVT